VSTCKVALREEIKKYTYKSDVQCETACDTYAQTNDKKTFLWYY